MRQALEMALVALERSVATCFDQRSHDAVMGRPEHFVNQAITAIKEALAQPEQEPVAEYVGFTDYARTEDDAHGFGKVKRLKFIPLNARLYTTPPQRKPLTDEQREQIYNEWCSKRDEVSYDDLMLAVEAANGIKEKNT